MEWIPLLSERERERERESNILSEKVFQAILLFTQRMYIIPISKTQPPLSKHPSSTFPTYRPNLLFSTVLNPQYDTNANANANGNPISPP